MKGILFASFGTTDSTARLRQIDATAGYLRQRFPDWAVSQAYTSGVIRRVWAERGVAIPDIPAALTEMARQGVAEAVVQPGLLLPGEEYDKLAAQAEDCRPLFSRLAVGSPLLASTGDLHRLADILGGQYPPRPQTAVVLLGHGTRRFANLAYAALDYRFKELGRGDLYVGALEAYPSLATVRSLLERESYQNILLAPLMQVAGEHARSDMAGEEPDSWASVLRAAGYRVDCRMTGLGQLPAVQEMVADHLRRAMGQGGGGRGL